MGRRNLVRVRCIVVAAIFDLIGENRNSNPYGRCKGHSPHFLLSSGSFNMAVSLANCAPKEKACTAGQTSARKLTSYFSGDSGGLVEVWSSKGHNLHIEDSTPFFFSSASNILNGFRRGGGGGGYSGFQVTGTIERFFLKFSFPGFFFVGLVSNCFWRLDTSRDFCGKSKQSTETFNFFVIYHLMLSGNFQGSEIGHRIFWG